MTRKNFTKDLFQRSRKIVSLKAKSPKTRTLRLESLEERQLLSATPEGLLATSGNWGVVSENAPEPNVLGLDKLSSAVGDYDEGDLAVVEALGLTAESDGVEWNDEGRLVSLSCSRLGLTTLNVSGCVDLRTLTCSSNQLTSIELSNCPNLEWLDCCYNSLEELNVSGCGRLTWLYCHNNLLDELDVSNCENLSLLYCQGNPLTDLDVSNCPYLQTLYCGESIASLDFSNCALLEDLRVFGGSLSEFDASYSPNLKTLFCYLSSVEELDLSGNAELNDLYFVSSIETISLRGGVDVNVEIPILNEWDSLEVVDGNGLAIQATYKTDYRRWGFTVAPDAAFPISVVYYRDGAQVGSTTISQTYEASLPSPTLALTSATANSLTVAIGEVDGATSYVLEYGTDENYENCETLNVLASGELVLGGLDPETTYYLRVKATDGETGSDWTDLTAETLIALETPALTLVSADFDAISLEIGEVDGADGYVLEYSKDPNFATGVRQKSFAEAGVVEIYSLTRDTAYYWRVQAIREGGDASDWTTLTAATTRYRAADLALLQSLGIEPSSPRVEWTERDVIYNGVDYQAGVLVSLDCSGMNLTSLDVSKGSYLQSLDCSNNSLTELDLSALGYLRNLSCYSNNISSLKWCGSEYSRTIYIDGPVLKSISDLYLYPTCEYNEEYLRWEYPDLYVNVAESEEYDDLIVWDCWEGVDPVEKSGGFFRFTIDAHFVENYDDGDTCPRGSFRYMKDGELVGTTCLNPEGALSAPVVTATPTSSSVVLTINNYGYYNIIEYGTDPDFATFSRTTVRGRTANISDLDPLTQYYFRVKATSDINVDSDWSETTSVKTALPVPTVSDLTSTANALSFEIVGVDSAQNYVVEYATDSTFADCQTNVYASAGTKSITDLIPGTTYYLRVKATAEGLADSDWLETSTTTDLAALDAPTLTVLAATDNSAILSIGAVADATSYVVEYSTSETYENSSTATFSASGEVQIASLNPNTEYYFRVEATADGFDDSEWTEATATTLAVKLDAPTVAVVATETEISVTVSVVPSAESYVLEYATNPEFANASTRTTSSAGTVVLSDLPEATQFYVRVKATAANYIDSDWTIASVATLDPLLVTNVEDSYATTGSLRRALAKAKDGDVVRFAPELAGQTILLVNGELIVDKAITIDASAVWNDADSVPGIAINADSKSRVFNIDADATLVALSITGGKAEQGGGVLVAENYAAELTRCVVAENAAWSEQNSTTVRGAGICALGDLTLAETVVRDNAASTAESVSTAYVFGGGIYVGADLALISSVVAKNKTEAKTQNLAYSFGAGIYVASSGTAVVVDSSIRLNTSEFYMPNDFAASFSRSFGGGAFVAENGSLVVNSSDVSNNYAKHQGGGVYSQGVVLVSNESVVQTNKSNSFGGGLCSEGELTIDGNSLVVGNYSGSGGGVYSIGKLTASNVEIRVNVAETSARAEGGGLDLGGPSTILESRIFANSAKAVNPSVSVTAQGGGVCVDASRNSAANVSITNCALFGNDVEAISGREANARGGGLYSNAALASVVATNVEISGNLVEATSYGTIRNQDSAFAQGGGVCGDFGLTLVNASIVANSAEATALSSNAFDDGDGARFYGRGTRDLFALDNCVVALNGDEGDDLARTSETVVNGRNSLSSFAEWSNASESGVENYPYAPNDPIFADFEGGDYRPALDGQLVDRGDDELLPSGVLVDLDGNARVQNVVDLGAYETSSEGRLAPPSLSVARDGASVLLEIGASEDASRYAIEYGTDPTFAASSSITRDSAGSCAIEQIPSDVTLYVRVRAEALGRVSSVWTRDYVGTYGESAAWESTTDVLPDAYEPNDSTPFATDLGAICDATTLQINLHSASDVDLFKFSTVANGGAGNFVRVEYAKATDGIDVALELYDASGARVATSKGPTGVEEISLENLPAGEYYVRIANVRSTAKPGDCALTIAPPAPLREGELDRPVFDAAPSDSSVVVDIAEVPGASQYVAQYGTNPDFTGASERVFDSPGAKTLAGLAPSTLYYVRVKALGGTPIDSAPLFDEGDAPLPNDELAAESEWTAISVKTDAPRDACEPNDALDEAFDLGTVFGESTRALNLHSDSDVDWFKFSLAATCGSDREIRLTFSETIGADLDMELFDSQGERVALANGTSDVETISLAKFRPGDYWLRVYNASPRPGVVDYELAILAPEENALDAPIATILEINRNSFDVDLTEVDGAETYVLEFGTDPGYENASTKTYATSGVKTLDNLPEGVRIYCRVKAVADARESAWFEFDETTTIPRDYCEPNDSIDASRSLGTLSESAEFTGFTFHSETDEDWYSFAIVANGGEENVVRALYDYDADRFALGLLLYDSEGRLVAGSERSGDVDELSLANLLAGAYRLRVYNRSASPATGRYSFRFAPPASLPEGTLDRPILAATVSDKSIVLVATDVPNATQFVVEYGTDPTFENSLTLVGNGVFAIDGLTPETSYWLRVKAIADGLVDSVWSELVLSTSGERDLFEPNDSIEAATNLGTLSGESRCDLTLHDGTDVDWFKFVLSDPDGEGRLVKLTYPQSATVDVDLELYDANGALVAASRETTGVETISIEALPAGTYFVRAFNYLASGDSTPYSLEFSAPVPVVKILAAPEIAGSTTKTAIVVKIYPVEWAERYVLEYGTDPTFATCKTKTYTSVAQPKTFSGLETGTPYYVRVRAVAEGLDDSPSSTLTLIPGGLTLTAPNLSASATKTAVVVNIKPVDDADQYVLEYGLNPDFSDAVAKTYKTSGPKTFTKAPFGTPYYFRVKAIGEGVNDSKWSEISFAAGQLASTTLKSTGVNYDRVEFSVTSVPNAVGCAIEYSKSPDFSDSTLVSFSTFGAKTIAGLDENSTYYFRAKALGDGTNRCDSAWTSTLVKSTVSYQGELAAPSVSFTMVKTSIVVKFAAVPSATKYVLDFGLDPNFTTYSTKVYATAGSKTITGLQSGATYYFRLRSTAPGYDDSVPVRFTAATTPPASSAVLDAESPFDDACLDEFEELEEFWDLLAEAAVRP